MNITQAFLDYLEDEGYEDIYIGGVPQDAPDEAMWRELSCIFTPIL